MFVFDEKGIEHRIGGLRIASAGMDTKPDSNGKRNSVKLPKSPFTELGSQYFSLGMSEKYYDNLKRISPTLKEAVLTGLRDMAFDKDIWEKFKDEDVTTVSLLRGSSINTVEDQFRRIISGGAVLTPFHFQFAVPTPVEEKPYEVWFSVKPEPDTLPTPPTNVHAIIGRNGCGKTFLLRHIAESMIREASTMLWDGIDAPDRISGLVFIGFSPFDRLHSKILPGPNTMPFPVVRVSLHDQDAEGIIHVKTPDELTEEIVESVHECAELGRLDKWQDVMSILHSDPGFADHRFSKLNSSNKRKIEKNSLRKICSGLSSGHKIVLLSLSKLVESTLEKSLVLIDEPETHLHPPLLSSFVRAVSEIMLDRNGVAILATHSPVVLQEIARKCVWKLDRFGSTIVANRPSIETFGENVNTLTREVFSYEVSKSGFHQLLLQAVKECDSFDSVMRKFKNQLGGEAQAIVRGHMARKLDLE
ncbi:AAA family ATPase [Akkermansiaceae bacterium]|nr:AAA family ATPase [Akkermansiaceae bacterium]